MADSLEVTNTNSQRHESINSGQRNVVIAFTVLGVVSLAAVRLFKSVKAARDASQDTVPAEPAQTAERAVTPSELAEATGEADKPIYIAMKDPYSSKITVFDVSSGRDFYGPGCPYNIFTGKDATYGLATSCLDPEKVTGDISNLTESQKDTHMQWHAKYSSKYTIVGYLVSDDAAGTDEAESVQTSEPKKDV